MSQDDVELRKLLAAYSGGDIVGFRTRFRTHEDQDQTLVNATGEELAVTYSEDTARFIAASVNYTRAALSAMPPRLSPELIAKLTALASRLTAQGEYEAVDLIDTVVARVTAMPGRELLREALDALTDALENYGRLIDACGICDENPHAISAAKARAAADKIRASLTQEPQT